MKIHELKLFSPEITSIKSFYIDRLGFAVAESHSSGFTLEVGRSRLSFSERPGASPYHFAFTIPSNQEYEALSWLKQRVEIVKFNNGEIVDFKNWNAKSIYFHDSDNNIVELIARKNLPYRSTQPFSAQNVVEISEIGMPVDNIGITFKDLAKRFSLNIFDGNFDRFCAVGDEQGLFIIIDIQKKRWFPSEDEAFLSEFEITFSVRTKKEQLSFAHGKINDVNKA